jgi:hypothetical protein
MDTPLESVQVFRRLSESHQESGRLDSFQDGIAARRSGFALLQKSEA